MLKEIQENNINQSLFQRIINIFIHLLLFYNIFLHASK